MSKPLHQAGKYDSVHLSFSLGVLLLVIIITINSAIIHQTLSVISHQMPLTHLLEQNMGLTWSMLQEYVWLTGLASLAFFRCGRYIELAELHWQSNMIFFLYHLYAKHDFNVSAYSEMHAKKFSC